MTSYLIGDKLSHRNYRYPRLTARSDTEGDAVVGEAPSGAEIRVTAGLAANAPTVSTTAAANGTYRADFGGVLDIESPMNGSVVVGAVGGHEFFTEWAAVQLSVQIGSGFVSGNGPPDRELTITLRDPDGTPVASGGDTVFRPFSGTVVIGPGVAGRVHAAERGPERGCHCGR